MPRRDDDSDDRPRYDEDSPRPRRRRFDDEDDHPRRRRDEDDYDDRGRAKGSNGAAVASLVLGVLGFCFGALTGIPAFILGLIGLSRAKAARTGGGMAVAGLVLGGLTTLVHGAVVLFLVVPQFQTANWRKAESNKLRQVGLAEHNYHDVYNTFPGPTAAVGAAAQRVPDDPSRELSWRVSLLPYVEQESLYQRFQLDQPWDAPANRPLADLTVPVFTDSDDRTDPRTRYRVFHGGGAMFELGRPTRMSGVTDGLSNTILVIDTPDKVTWSQFNELRYDPQGPLPPLGRSDRDVMLVLLADGSVRAVRKTTREAVLRGMITKSGGEMVPFE